MAEWKSVCNIVLRSLAAMFSLIALALMASEDYKESDGFLFLLIINVIACAYSLGHILVYVIHKLSRFQAVREVSFKVIVFVFDQALAYGLLSGASVAARDVKVLQQINDLVEEVESIASLYPGLRPYLSYFTAVKQEYDSGVGGVVMGVFSFVAFGLSALLSGYQVLRSVLDSKPSGSGMPVVNAPMRGSPAEERSVESGELVVTK